MDDEEMTPNDTSRANEEVKTEPPGKSESSEDFIPLQKHSQPEEKEPNTVPKQNNGNGNEKNVQKRLKINPDDGTSKKPRITPDPSATFKKRSTESGDISDTEEYYLTVSNLPSNWTYVQIKNYLDKECGHVDEMEMMNKDIAQGCTIRLTYQSLQKCKDVLKKLKDKVVQDKILIVNINEPMTILPPGVSVPAAPSLNKDEPDIKESLRPWIQDQDTVETGPQNLYGLRPQYLGSLNIVPPLSKLVHVTNFRCDKNELKEVMELAGNVVMCCVVASSQRYAKVMYNHPLEAVQAISMLNGQMFYGNPLKISMDRNPEDTIVLPKGLAGVGLGLGVRGKPIRNIEQQYQKYTKNQNSLLNPIIFSKVISTDNSISEENQDEIQSKINEFIKSTHSCNLLNHKLFKSKNIDQLEVPETNLKIDSDRSTPEINTTKASLGGSRKSSVDSLSPNRDPLNKNGSDIPNNFIKPPLVPLAPTQTPMVRICQNTKGTFRPGLLHNPPVHNLMPIPTPGHPNYGPPGPPGPTNFGNQPRPGQFGPRPVPFMPPQRPAFGPQGGPAAFGPPGPRPQMPPGNFGGARPFVGPNAAVPRPNINPGNRVTVNFSNLPPSTTFPLLCEQLSQCGQVMSVQLTTPGCAVATFGHPSHAERCFQTFNRMNIEGYVIDVKFA